MKTSATQSLSKPILSTNLLITAGVVTGLAAASLLLVYSLTKKPKKLKSNIDTSENKVTIATSTSLGRETLVSILTEITQGVQQVIMRLAQEEQRIVNSPEAHRITSEQLQGFLIQRFQELVAQVEIEIYEKFKVKEDDVRDATTVHEADEDVKRCVNQLKNVYGAVMGNATGELPEVPGFMTKQKTLEILEKTMEILREKAKKVSKEVSSKGIDRTKQPEKFQQMFQISYGKAVEEERKKLYTSNGIEDDMIIQAAVVKYQNDADFQVSLKQASESHNAKMAELGFFPNQGGM